MHNKPTYKQLENQVFELKKLNEALLLKISNLNQEKHNLADKTIKQESKEKVKRDIETAVADKEKQKRLDEIKILTQNLLLATEEKSKKAEETDITNKELLRLIQLNIDKNSFISILAHDLKSPFSSILGFLDLLLKNIRNYDIDRIENHLNIVNKSAKNTLALLDDILMWARASSGKIPFQTQVLNFTEICKDVVESLKLTANIKNITINYFSSTEILILADENMLKTILRNLISNAIKYTNKNGHIDIYREQDNSFATISVSDNGVGMNQDTLNKLFDISADISTKGTENESGTGLGLLLCKEFIEKHNGKIWAESDLGEGSRFNFTIPAL